MPPKYVTYARTIAFGFRRCSLAMSQPASTPERITSGVCTATGIQSWRQNLDQLARATSSCDVRLKTRREPTKIVQPTRIALIVSHLWFQTSLKKLATIATAACFQYQAAERPLRRYRSSKSPIIPALLGLHP